MYRLLATPRMGLPRSLGMSGVLFALVASTMHLKGAVPVAMTMSPAITVVCLVVSVLVGQGIQAITKTILGSLSPEQQRNFFWPLFGSTLLLLLMHGIIDEQVKTPAAPWGMFSYQQAFTPEKTQEILSSWSDQQRIWVAFALGLDQLLIVLYSFSVALACMIVGAGDELANDLAAAQFVAGLLDFIENAFSLYNLQTRFPLNPQNTLGAGICSTLKFAMVAGGVIYVVILYCFQAMRPGARFD